MDIAVFATDLASLQHGVAVLTGEVGERNGRFYRAPSLR
jgi:hypothetical protein